MGSNCSTWDLRVAGQTASNSSMTIEGKLEICYNKKWYSLAQNNFPFTVWNEKFVCQSLGYEANAGKCILGTPVPYVSFVATF